MTDSIEMTQAELAGYVATTTEELRKPYYARENAEVMVLKNQAAIMTGQIAILELLKRPS